MKGQKEALIDEIKNFGITLPTKVTLNAGQFELITDALTDGIVSGEIAYSKTSDTPQEIRRYVRSMIKNHLNKALELNGGVRKSTAAAAQPKKETGPALDKSALTSGLSGALDAFMGNSSGAEE